MSLEFVDVVDGTKALCTSLLGAGLGRDAGILESSVGLSLNLGIGFLSSVGLLRDRGTGTGLTAPVTFPVLLALGMGLGTLAPSLADSATDDKVSAVLLWGIWEGVNSSSKTDLFKCQ